MSRRLLAVIVAFVAFVTLRADERQRFDQVVRADFFAGFNGDGARLEKAMSACETALAANPKQAEARVWHGAGLYFRAGEAFRSGDVEKGRDLARRGLAEMDDAVALEPANIAVVIPRAATLTEATRRMNEEQARPLLEKAMADYEMVLKVQEPILPTLDDHSKSELLFALADGWSRLGDLTRARQYFERLIAAVPDGRRSAEARARLAAGVAPSGPAQRCAGCHG
jgi:tetratricopeptide (TPR) repeat protein